MLARSNLMPLWKKTKAREMRKNPTPAEEVLWEKVRKSRLGYRFKRQKMMWGYIVDFYCYKKFLVVEIDGSIHKKTISYDKKRDDVLKEKGLTTLRFSNYQVLNQIDYVIKTILNHDNKR